MPKKLQEMKATFFDNMEEEVAEEEKEHNEPEKNEKIEALHYYFCVHWKKLIDYLEIKIIILGKVFSHFLYWFCFNFVNNIERKYMQREFFYRINALVLIDTTTFAFMVPILPDFLMKKGIFLWLIGVVLSFFQISSIITSLYLGKNLIHFSKSKIIIIGQIFLVVSNVGLGFLDLFSTKAAIIIFAILFRLLQGASISFVLSACYSYIPILCPEDLENSFTFIEITTGLGLALGPVIAGFLYQYTGFTCSFLVIGLCYTLAGFVILPFMQIKRTEQKSIKKVKVLSVLEVFKNRNFILTMMIFSFSFMTYCIIQPDFSHHIHSYNGTDDTVGMIFGLSDLMYALTGLFMINFITKMHLKRKYIFIFGGFLSMLSLLIIGPDDITFLPKNLIVVTIGMIILGCSQMFYFPIFIPEILDILKEIDPNAMGSEELSSSLFITVSGGATFIGSILGGCLTDQFGFSRGVTVYALGLLVVLVVYVVMRKNEESYNEIYNNGMSNLELTLIEKNKAEDT